MSHTITLKLPDGLYEPIQRMAHATRQSLETMVLTALQTSLPSLEGLDPAFTRALTELTELDNDALWQVMLATVPHEQQAELNELLERNQAGALTSTECERLTQLQRAADLLMLRKARAAVLLRFRGQRLPTLAELRQLTVASA
jgi:hypothetical protein